MKEQLKVVVINGKAITVNNEQFEQIYYERAIDKAISILERKLVPQVEVKTLIRYCKLGKVSIDHVWEIAEDMKELYEGE